MNSLPTRRHVVRSRIARFCYFLKGAQDAQRLRTTVLSVYKVNCKHGSESLLRESALSISQLLQSKAKVTICEEAIICEVTYDLL